MNCTKCGGGKNDVVDTRPSAAGVWRRRQCRTCGDTWTTVEIANPSDAVIKAMSEEMVEAARKIMEAMTILKKMITRGGIA